MAWNKNKPEAGDALNTIATSIPANNQAIQDEIGTPGSDADGFLKEHNVTGAHKAVRISNLMISSPSSELLRFSDTGGAEADWGFDFYGHVQGKRILVADTALSAGLQGDAIPRLAIKAGGELEFSNSINFADAGVARDGAGSLKLYNPNAANLLKLNVYSDATKFFSDAGALSFDQTFRGKVVSAAEAKSNSFNYPAWVHYLYVRPNTLDGNQNEFYIPVTGLPYTALIGSFEVFGLTAGSGVVSAALYRVEKSFITPEVAMASVTFSGGGVSGNDGTIVEPIVSDNHRYYIRGYVSSTGVQTDSSFYSARINYSVTNAGQI